MNRKLLGRIISAVIVGSSIIICLVGYRMSEKRHSKQRLENAEITVKQERTQLNSLEEAVSSFYLDEEKVFLKPDLLESTVQDTKEALTNVKVSAEDFGLVALDTDTTDLANKKKELLAEVETMQQKIDLQAQVSGLFDTPIEDWVKVNSDYIIKTTTTKSIIQQIKSNLVDYNDAWSQSLNTYLDNANQQIVMYEELSATISSFLQGDELSGNGTVENYYELVEQLKQVKNEELLQELTTQLKKVESLMFP